MFLSSVVIRSIVAELENRGHHAERLLRAASIDRQTLARPSAGIRFRDFDRLVKQAFEITEDPSLGLTIGTQAPETMLHVLGMLMVTTRTLREAVAQVNRYGGLVLSGVDWQLSEQADQATFSYRCDPNEAARETQRFAADCTIALALRIGRHFAPRQPPTEISFQHAAPSYAADYPELFGCGVRFEQPTNAVVFPRALLDRVQPHADPMLSSLLRELAEGLHEETRGESSFSARVRMALRYETDLANVDFERLARRWGVTRRVLRRRLSSEGLSLTELLDEARCARAVDELRRPETKIKDVAEDLGYSETSAFHRAFKRWTGRTPSDYKAELRDSRMPPAVLAAFQP